jgi:hypothetical protein
LVGLATGTNGAEYVDQSMTGFPNLIDVAAGTHVWAVDQNLDALRILW